MKGEVLKGEMLERQNAANANTPWARKLPEADLSCRQQGFARDPGEVEFFRRGCLRLFCRCFLQTRVPKGRNDDTTSEAETIVV